MSKQATKTALGGEPGTSESGEGNPPINPLASAFANAKETKVEKSDDGGQGSDEGQQKQESDEGQKTPTRPKQRGKMSADDDGVKKTSGILSAYKKKQESDVKPEGDDDGPGKAHDDDSGEKEKPPVKSQEKDKSDESGDDDEGLFDEIDTDIPGHRVSSPVSQKFNKFKEQNKRLQEKLRSEREARESAIQSAIEEAKKDLPRGIENIDDDPKYQAVVEELSKAKELVSKVALTHTAEFQNKYWKPIENAFESARIAVEASDAENGADIATALSNLILGFPADSKNDAPFRKAVKETISSIEDADDRAEIMSGMRLARERYKEMEAAKENAQETTKDLQLTIGGNFEKIAEAIPSEFQRVKTAVMSNKEIGYERIMSPEMKEHLGDAYVGQIEGSIQFAEKQLQASFRQGKPTTELMEYLTYAGMLPFFIAENAKSSEVMQQQEAEIQKLNEKIKKLTSHRGGTTEQPASGGEGKTELHKGSGILGAAVRRGYMNQ